jgi:hypothetical protein
MGPIIQLPQCSWQLMPQNTELDLQRMELQNGTSLAKVNFKRKSYVMVLDFNFFFLKTKS